MRMWPCLGWPCSHELHWCLQRSWLPLLWDQWEGPVVGSCLLFHLAYQHINLWWFGRIHAWHDVPDSQCRHEFSHSNTWTVLTDVPPKELRWPLCTGWTLGWCIKLPMPVSVHSYERCPVVLGWCLMPCHTKCNQSNLERTMARYSMKSVSLSPPHFKWALKSFVRVLSQFWLGFADPWDILTQIQAVCLWGQSCEGLGWCHIASLSHRLFPSQRWDQLPVASEQRHPHVVGRATMFSETTLASV